MAKNDRIKIIAHRGMGPTSKLSGKGTATEDVPPEFTPENTLKAFRQSIDEGADGIEFDIYVSKDGVPVVIHDDELNINVIGADRSARDLGLISEKTLQEIKQYNVGQGEVIPTLQETIELFIHYNVQRAEKSLPPLIMNVELKGIGSGESALLLINRYINDGLINKDYVVYCSFEHNELKRIRELDADAKLSPSIKSAFLWGKENVLKPGFYIPMNIEFPQKGIEYIQKLHDELKVTAFDPILFDIDAPLVDFAKSLGIALYASTSDFRDFSNKAFLQLLVNINKHVPIYFKTDEPKKIYEMLEEYEEVMKLDLSNIIILDSKEIQSLTEEQNKRIPKVGQPEHTLKLDTDKVESSADKFNSLIKKLVIELNEMLKSYIVGATPSLNQELGLMKVIEIFGHLQKYMPNILSIKEEVVLKIMGVLEGISDAIHHKHMLPNDLKLQIETLITVLDEQEINVLKVMNQTRDVQANIVTLETDIAFFQKDVLVSGVQLLNDVSKQLLSHDTSQPSLISSIEFLKNGLHINQHNHPSKDINDDAIAAFLNGLLIKIQNHDDIAIQELKFIVSINNELQAILTGFQQSDKENELYWIKAAKEVANMNEALKSFIDDMHILHDEL